MFFVSVLFPVPCGFIIRAIKNPYSRMWAIFILGMFLQLFFFGYSNILNNIYSCSVYVYRIDNRLLNS